MSDARTRKLHNPELKAKVGLEVVRGAMTINEIGKPEMELDWRQKSQGSARRDPARLARKIQRAGRG
jgi:hypothetical protein